MNKITVFGVAVLLIVNTTMLVFANEENIHFPNANGKEMAEEVADTLANDHSTEEKNKIEKELEAFENVDIPIDRITEVKVKKNGSKVYEINFDNKRVNKLEITESNEHFTEIVSTEDGVQNTIRYDEDGTLYIDNIKIDYGDASKSDEGFECSGYSTWQRKCPKKVKTWEKRYLLSQNGDLRLPKAAKLMTTTALGAYLGGFAVVKCIGYIATTYEFASILKGHDPTATAVSVKVYARNSKNPIGIQHRKSYWYAKKKYKECILTENSYAFRWV